MVSFISMWSPRFFFLVTFRDLLRSHYVWDLISPHPLNLWHYSTIQTFSCLKRFVQIIQRLNVVYDLYLRYNYRKVTKEFSECNKTSVLTVLKQNNTYKFKITKEIMVSIQVWKFTLKHFRSFSVDKKPIGIGT